MRASITWYIWADTIVRIRYNILSRHKAQGGLGLPNLELYYRSAQLIRVIDWFHNRESKSWVEI